MTEAQRGLPEENCTRREEKIRETSVLDHERNLQHSVYSKNPYLNQLKSLIDCIKKKKKTAHHL